VAAAGPHEFGKAVIFRAKAKFFGQKPAAKNVFVFIKLKSRIHSCQRDEVPKIRFFPSNNYWVG